jgi:glycosyltransferase involved in cell wall biosynthesis
VSECAEEPGGGGKLTILHLVANRWWTGSADPVIRLAQGLEQRGHRVLVGLVPGDRFEAKAREAGFEPVAGLGLDVRSGPARVLRDLLRIRRLVREEGVTVVHAHHSHDHWLGALGRGRAALVRTFHHRRAVRDDAPSRALYRRTDAIIAVSGAIAARCADGALAAGRVVRVDGVVDTARFAAASGGAGLRAELGLGAGPVVGCVARLAPARGHELLIGAFARLLADRPRARLVLAGKGEARVALEALVARRGLAGQVIFAGYRDGDLPALLDALDVFTLMDAGSDETCRAALEAMAAGRPVVAPRVGALPDAIEHGVTGLLVERATEEAMAAALAVLLDDPPRARAMGAAARGQALERFTPARHAAATERVYETARARRR